MTGMVDDPLALSDVAVTVPSGDPAAAAAVYTAMIGEPESGTARWRAGNGSLTVVPASADDDAPRVRFQAHDAEAAQKLLTRRGLRPDEVRAVGVTAAAGARSGAPVLDHVVFTAPSVDAGIALFGGRLGLNLRLVREFGPVSQLFFRTPSVVVEVLAGAENPGIALWGLAWHSDDLDAEHDRLVRAGLALSEIRAGRKPGTRVMTVREPALGVPTILIEQQPRPR